MRKEIVELAHDLNRLRSLADAQMRDLTRRVHAGVGASRAADVDFAEHAVRGLAEVALNRLLRVTLRLPS